MSHRFDSPASPETTVQRAADALRGADALLITAGAGMGVDSGLPDFRGSEGFWRAYPPYRKLGLHFEQLANPSAFRGDPQLAWGFYGHRLKLYRSTRPHRGFETLLRWGQSNQAAALFSPPTSTATSKPPASRQRACLSATAPSITCSAQRPAAAGYGPRTARKSRSTPTCAQSIPCRVARDAARSPGRTS